MHTSTSVDVYLHIDSNPVIEHCTNLRFAPFPAALAEAHTLVRLFGWLLEANRSLLLLKAVVPNLSVQDFSHIRATPSPNWSVLPNEECLRQEDWNRMTTLDGGDPDALLQKFLSKPQV